MSLLWGCKVTKTCGYLNHNRASEGHGSFPGMASQTALHRYFQRFTGIDPCPYLLGQESNDDQFSITCGISEKNKGAYNILDRCRELPKRKNFFQVRCTLNVVKQT